MWPGWENPNRVMLLCQIKSINFKAIPFKISVRFSFKKIELDKMILKLLRFTVTLFDRGKYWKLLKCAWGGNNRMLGSY